MAKITSPESAERKSHDQLAGLQFVDEVTLRQLTADDSQARRSDRGILITIVTIGLPFVVFAIVVAM